MVLCWLSMIESRRSLVMGDDSSISDCFLNIVPFSLNNQSGFTSSILFSIRSTGSMPKLSPARINLRTYTSDLPIKDAVSFTLIFFDLSISANLSLIVIMLIILNSMVFDTVWFAIILISSIFASS